jgi:hypothetical protein
MAGIDYGTPFSETATHATAAVASHTGATGKTYYITDISASSDKAGAILLVKQGTTTIWQLQIGTTAHSHHFGIPLRGASGALVSVSVDGTSACKANIAGYEL